MLLFLFFSFSKDSDLLSELLEFLLGLSDPVFHLLHQRSRILGHREETDIVLICNYILLKLIVLLDEAVLFRKYRPSSTTATVTATSLTRELGAESLLISLCDIIFLLERNETDLLPSSLEFLHSSYVRFIILEFVCLDFLDQTLLGLEIAIEIVFRLGILVTLGKELVTSGAESLPELLRLLAWNCTDLLPLFLKIDELVSSLLPLCA